MSYQQKETIPCIAHAVRLNIFSKGVVIWKVSLAFLVGGAICVIGQIMMDVFRMTPHIL